MTRKILLAAFLISLFTVPNLQAQVILREFGIRTGGLNSFGFIYKTAKPTSKTYKRFSAGVVEFKFLNSDEIKDISIGLILAVGFEHRLSLSDKFEVLYGFQPYIKGYYSDSENILRRYDRQFLNGNNLSSPYPNVQQGIPISKTSIFVAGLGYIVGLQYQVMKNCMVGIETIPSLYIQSVNQTTKYENSNREDENFQYTNGGFSFSSNAIALSFIYQFSMYKR